MKTRHGSELSSEGISRYGGAARALVGAAGLFCGVLLGAGAATAQNASLVIVFDGSGSMWAKFPANGSQPRFGAAREALKAGLAELRTTGVGLVTFGNRPQASCTDIQTTAPVEIGDSERIIAPLEKLNPRGKGPLVQAVREAATLLKSAEGERHILLVHDDPDNCGQDACQAASTLAASDPRLKVHVVSIAMRADDPGRPVCLARSTGGLSFLAESQADLTKAVAEVVQSIGTRPIPAVRAAAKDPAPAPRSPAPAAALEPGTPAVPSRPRREVPTEGAPRLLLGARLASGAPLLDAPLSWRVKAADGTIIEGGDVISAGPDVALAAGRYEVVAESGAVKVSAQVDVRAVGATEFVADLDAGIVRIAAPAKRGGAPSPSAALTLRRPGPDGAVLWLGAGSTAGVLVPAGEVVAIAGDGSSRRELQVKVEAGKVVDIALPLEAGRLQLAAMVREGGAPATDVVYRVMEDDPQAPEGLREVARSSAAAPDLVLPAGSYVVVASIGGAEARERITVTPGEEIARVLVLNAGRVRVDAKAQGGPAVAGLPVQYTFRRTGAATETVASSSTDRQPQAWLAAGRYRLELRVGEQNATTAGEIEVRAGSDVVVTQSVPVGRLTLASPAYSAGADFAWEVQARDGSVVSRTLQPEPKLLLAPGRYKVTLLARNQRRSKDVDVQAGEVRVDIGLD